MKHNLSKNILPIILSGVLCGIVFLFEIKLTVFLLFPQTVEELVSLKSWMTHFVIAALVMPIEIASPFAIEVMFWSAHLAMSRKKDSSYRALTNVISCLLSIGVGIAVCAVVLYL